MEFFSSCSASCKRANAVVAKRGLLILVVFLLSLLVLESAEAYDPLDPNSNITIKWDIKSWTSDGYIALVTIFNFQKYRHIEAPGWKLGWKWAEEEIIWETLGGEATEQGDCSRFKGSLPHSCEKNPEIVDLLPGTPYNQQVSNCCRGGVLSAWAQDPANSVSSFQLHVGQSGTSNDTVKLPMEFTLRAPGGGYTCGTPRIAKPSKFITPNKRRVTQALMTWNVTCGYSQFLAHRVPTCCVSLSSFRSRRIVDCPACSCGCKNSTVCLESDSRNSAEVLSRIDKNSHNPSVGCTNHMCPIQVHWHVKANYKDYWRVKITITSFNYRMNYSQWNLVVQHPNLNTFRQAFSFNFKSLPLHESYSWNDIGMFWGVKFHNDLLMQAGPYGNVQSELLFGKDKSTFTFEKGWAFPRQIYFNGDKCVMPPPDLYSYMPNDHATQIVSLVHPSTTTLLLVLFLALMLLECYKILVGLNAKWIR